MPRGGRRTTILFWKRMLKEAGLDWVKVERLAADREGLRKTMYERMKHPEQWEWKLILNRDSDDKRDSETNEGSEQPAEM